MITSDYRGEGGGQEGPKYDYVIFECSLKVILTSLRHTGCQSGMETG